ncbi:MAG TPA: D-ribose pyranase [Clostridiales bacterium]|nr:D-ribose pyranase [Clostridiales bacterium]
MYKGECLNSQLLRIMGETGHTDLICVCDAGFPVPQNVEKVDLAWKPGKPGFIEVCRMLGDNMVLEKVYLAEEIKKKNQAVLQEFTDLFPNIELVFMSHEELKKLSKSCRAVVRTGEFSAYSNCIFAAGCAF